MTDKEKLRKALDGLKFIADGGCKQVGEDERYAAKVYAELTAPRVETVEVKRWVWKVEVPRPVGCPEIINTPPVEREKHLWVELTGTFSRPIEEKEEVWEGNIHHVIHLTGGVKYAMIDRLPPEWLDKTVEVRLKGE